MTASSAPASRPLRRRRRLATGLAAAGLAAAFAVPAHGPEARADDAVARPAAGAFTVSGRGFGHGRGMSQWGAYGAATSGLGWRQILDFYYPGTFRHVTGDSAIRVWISGDDDGVTSVVPASGLAVTVGATRRLLPTGPGYRQWRALASGGRVAVQYLDAGGAWRAYAVPTGKTAVFSTSSGLVRVVHGSTQQELRGDVHAVLAGSTVRTVLSTTMESYLRGVVPHEMPTSWHTEAIAAQSVAARTYAASYRATQRARGNWYDICDSTTCQVFKGTATYGAGGARTPLEYARSDAAVGMTRGTVMRTSRSSDSSLVHAEFSASNGGYTAAGGPFYQVAKADPYDGRNGNPHTSWSTPARAAALEKAFPAVGSLRTVQVGRRTGQGALGGRVQDVRLVGSRGAVTTTGAKLRTVLGLRSDWFAVAGAPASAPAPTPAPAPAGARPAGGDVRDIDGDGGPDLLTVDAAGVLHARPIARGALGGPRRLGHGWQTMDAVLAAGQFDGTGGQDVIARRRSSGELVLYPGNGKGGFGRPSVLGRSGLSSLTSAGDLDGDGRRDLVGIDAARGRLVLLRGLPGGKLSAPTTIGTGWKAAWVRGAGDLTGDGRPDLISSSTSGVLTVHAVGAGAKITAQRTYGGGWVSLAHVLSVGDVTGDARSDILAVTKAGELKVYPGNGAWGIGGARTIGTGLAGLHPAL